LKTTNTNSTGDNKRTNVAESEGLNDLLEPKRTKRVEVLVPRELWSDFLVVIRKTGYASPSDFFREKIRQAVKSYRQKMSDHWFPHDKKVAV
jgi:hypothetical protein